jgi:hypothetical protein
MAKDASGIVGRARQVYSEKGLRSLIAEGTRFVTKDIWLELLLQRRSVSRSELKKLAAEEGGIWYLEEEEPFSVCSAPHPKLREAFRPYQMEWAPERPFVCELEECYLVGPYAVGMTTDGRIITETVPLDRRLTSKRLDEYFSSLRQYIHLSGLNDALEPEYKENQVFSLVTPYVSYYHWMTEYLPKLRYIEHYTSETGNEPTVLINSDSSRFVEETLEAAGYGPDNYKRWDKREARVSNLIIPIHRSHIIDYDKPDLSIYEPSQDDLLWLRNKTLSNIEDLAPEKDRRLYISRQEASPEYTSTRKVVNYDEMLSTLHDFGFESYILEELPFEKQVRLFAEADVVMGPHGAGLVNMIFANEPLVIEMFPEDTLKPHFYFISDMMDFDYEPIVTEAESSNLVVNTESLRDFLESVL